MKLDPIVGSTEMSYRNLQGTNWCYIIMWLAIFAKIWLIIMGPSRQTKQLIFLIENVWEIHTKFFNNVLLRQKQWDKKLLIMKLKKGVTFSF